MKRILSLLLSVLILLSLTTLNVSAANQKITSCLDLANIRRDDVGSGYEWDNIEKTLVLDGANISTSDEYGIKLPEGSTVVLNGDNYITSTKYGLHCLNSLIFTGSGTLTINAPEAGIFAASTLTSDVIQFHDGKITVINAKYGIYSENARLSFLGSTVSATSSECSVYGRDIRITGGNLELFGSVYSKGGINISGANITVTANKPAIVSATNNLTIDAKNIMVGSTASTLSSIGQYGGENCVKIIANSEKGAPSLLFGEGVSPVWDYVIVISAVLAIAAVIAIPLIIKQRKTAKLIALSQLNAKNTPKTKKQK